MWLLIGVGLFVTCIAALWGPRLRPWVVGVSLIACGFAVHVAFEVWIAGWAARFEMGSCAIVEALLFLAGLGCVLVSLLGPRPANAGASTRLTAWVLWLATVVMAALAVLIRLPP